ncbi:MAG: AAA family ATPase [Patescibacteria group bacterium]
MALHPFQSSIKHTSIFSLLPVENLLSHHSRHRLLKLTRWLIIVFFLTITIVSLSGGDYKNLIAKLVGGLLILLAIWLEMYLLELFYRGLTKHDSEVTLEVAQILYHTTESDLALAFGRSAIGQSFVRRTAIKLTAYEKFLQARTIKAVSSPLILEPGKTLTLSGLLTLILKDCPELKQCFAESGIEEIDAVATTDWLSRQATAEREAERWWSRAALARLPGLAKNWSYGQTAILDRYSHNLLLNSSASSMEFTASSETKQLITILERSAEANALLVGEAGENKMSVIGELVREIKKQTAPPALEHYQPILLHTAELVATGRHKDELEKILNQLLNEAARAGNILLIIDDFGALFIAAEKLGVDLINLLDPFLATRRLPMIALVDTEIFNRHVSTRPNLMRRFEVVTVKEIDGHELILRLEDQVAVLEQRSNIIFTYPAIKEIVVSAARYFPEAAPTDRALDLLIELEPWLIENARTVANRADIQEFVTIKTGIPAAEANGAEIERLKHLADQLSQQIIGQPEAIMAITTALQRSRAGLSNPKRPTGSFLFLGPTGVGKTETAKALARLFFRQPESVLRLDMTEFAADNALARLMEVLATMIRQHPYGILLLDEFEKSHPEVLNLFLQILDEGYFTDAGSRRVNARNLILIATSNAGADFIWEQTRANKPPSAWKDNLINEIINRGLFKPELVNRFDAVIIFTPLSPEALRAVAKLALTALAERLKAKGVSLPITDTLASVVANYGANQSFGARPMLRFVQDQIETPIAKKILAGEITAGQTINESLFATLH